MSAIRGARAAKTLAEMSNVVLKALHTVGCSHALARALPREYTQKKLCTVGSLPSG